MNLSIDSFPGILVPGAGVAWIIGVWVLTAIVHIFFALAILGDAEQLWRQFHRKTFFAGGGLWALATLLGGVTVVGVYWFIHHSSLRPQPNGTAATNPSKPPDQNPK